MLTDRMGCKHSAEKFPWKHQCTNGKGYTPSRRCAYGCKSKTRVYSIQCNQAFCFQLRGNEKCDHDGMDTAYFGKHVIAVRRTSGRK
jgi:hypothetical protein